MNNETEPMRVIDRVALWLKEQEMESPTYCWDINRDFMRTHKDTLEFRELHYTVDSLIATYWCKWDERVYTVEIKAHDNMGEKKQ